MLQEHSINIPFITSKAMFFSICSVFVFHFCFVKLKEKGWKKGIWGQESNYFIAEFWENILKSSCFELLVKLILLNKERDRGFLFSKIGWWNCFSGHVLKMARDRIKVTFLKHTSGYMTLDWMLPHFLRVKDKAFLKVKNVFFINTTSYRPQILQIQYKGSENRQLVEWLKHVFWNLTA